MAELNGTKVTRKGATARYFSEERESYVSIEGLPKTYTAFPRLELRFSVPVPGGTTDLKLLTNPSDFEALADAMMKTDCEAATRAFARAVFFSAKSKEVERRLYPERGRKKKA
ncbi:hypothetical protein HJC03_23560 [Rhizobium sp. NLR4b]|uniref:hypothetical protein n=1 Tax=unclassified Rhizobium TaxID=2613769 RepID=UPI0016092AA4|nr:MULTISPECIES: hypothetical protein [unclassified Rhizobium]MBB3355601.1 hypothetical protein [Rhizobium sp. BK049]MBX5253350.1 hypothetical protein [Rhizobium sp. NLR4b]